MGTAREEARRHLHEGGICSIRGHRGMISSKCRAECSGPFCCTLDRIFFSFFDGTKVPPQIQPPPRSCKKVVFWAQNLNSLFARCTMCTLDSCFLFFLLTGRRFRRRNNVCATQTICCA